MPYLGPAPEKLTNKDLDGGKLVLDADADTSITADTDDQIDIQIAGADDFQFTANTFTAQSGSTIAAQALTATSIAPATADGAALGSASAEFSDLYLADGGVIYFGNDQEIKLTHSADTGLILKHTATADDKPISLVFQTGEEDMAADDVLGKISFQGADEENATDPQLVAAEIAAVSEGDFSSSSNATKLSFRTGASEAASEKMSLSSAGILTIQGEGSNTTNATQGVLKFWANLSGAGTPALDDSFNCASVTDNGSGDRSIVIANDMASANFASLAAMPLDGNTNGNRGAGGYQISAQAAGSSRYVCMSGSTGSGDGLVSDAFTTEGIGGAGDLS